jgi:hypothetical protein
LTTTPPRSPGPSDKADLARENFSETRRVTRKSLLSLHSIFLSPACYACVDQLLTLVALPRSTVSRSVTLIFYRQKCASHLPGNARPTNGVRRRGRVAR